ncbi:DUF3006 domain-containing protein [Halalkalibacterium halodurans]|uniref:BH3962 protein n=1 Tax=Halalkalibacterium halodurans (strain ATCC BAA-125 / DSM 18197 / FERM 7344 / JCM 9153 / C-125) TaxID=272558 RepID=Q9K5X5_HALH5|nr:DUF3006 domain-containing protein [Halalkalibacterium halodurans]MED4083061.1 DUF3006 domain-containing protein [Halalkalibacterium halodurans]MED4087110.1 DUF3006 domain-containing protein [Halalkalibacterium halodurans]MED4106975.1 DUF3006 domain-containing protein [Halalkalibacterium halodurans]MED4111110.1 DUF3006 domain-containing protein [Halalkalibacterium halodurans]MED4123085.1 DUF3006 domain-containing protein [Halalkalibacterium halodurans]
MLYDGEHRAVLDRIAEDQQAILLVGEQEKELVIPKEVLPPEAKEGDHLLIVIENDQVTSVSIDDEGTAQAKRRIKEKMARLRNKKKRER